MKLSKKIATIILTLTLTLLSVLVLLPGNAYAEKSTIYSAGEPDADNPAICVCPQRIGHCVCAWKN